MVWVSRAVLVAVGVGACGDSAPQVKIVGQVWSDDNGNGVRDPGEAPLAGVLMFVNLDNDPTINSNEPYTRTDDDGAYEVVVPKPGEYPVRAYLPFGFQLPSVAAKPRIAAPIIGGSDVGPNDYGFMVAMADRFGNSVFQFCGGVLIDDRHVLTAAHCSAGANPTNVAVVAGTLDPQSGGQVLDVERISMHPLYDGDAGHGHDISVWTLKEPLDLDASGLRTVEMLHGATSLEQPGTLATTLGWGVSDRDSVLLQQVHLPLVSAADCQAVYSNATGFDTQICAGASEGGIDSCQGDSGGPLLVRDEVRQVWMHAGITSYGDGCALPDTPGVYSRVSALSDWVIETAGEHNEATVNTIAEIATPGTADFPAHSSTRPQIGPIAPRWQLTGITLSDTVPTNTPLMVRWSIIGDSATLSGFTCGFNADVASGVASQDVGCGLGATDLTLPGFQTGIFATELTAARDGVSFTRRVNVVAGTPAKTTTLGTLSLADPIDPDYSFAMFRVDYYDITGLAGTRAFAIDATSVSFSMFLTLYDLDQRDFANGGGILEIGKTTMDGTRRLVVVPEAGRRYLIGVSSLEADATGSYTVSIVNDGTLTAH